MPDIKSKITCIGGIELVSLKEYGIFNLPARIDTGARTSAIWASNIFEEDGVLYFSLFDVGSKYYDGKRIAISDYERRIVTPSNGISEERYMIKVKLGIAGRLIKSRITLADRSTQKYPVLVGRNVLRGKFIVNVKRKKNDQTKNNGEAALSRD